MALFDPPELQYLAAIPSVLLAMMGIVKAIQWVMDITGITEKNSRVKEGWTLLAVLLQLAAVGTIPPKMYGLGAILAACSLLLAHLIFKFSKGTPDRREISGHVFNVSISLLMLIVFSFLQYTQYLSSVIRSIEK